MKRGSGVLMHISSLWGDYSTGSFGKSSYEFIDFLAECGFTYWQVLPFCMVDECNSPYKSYSAFGGNPYFVDLEVLKDEGLLSQEELEPYRQDSPYLCEYQKLYNTRCDILMTASKRAKNVDEINAYVDKNPYLKQFCEFMAYKDANNQALWTEWTNFNIDADVLFMWKFIQFKFFEQWQKVLDYAHSKNIKIIGDIPIYVSFDSADVWANKENYQLNGDNPSSVAGVPPDYFCEDGQLWGNPLYNWERMQNNGFKWWIARLEHMFGMFDAVRIDHFRAIEGYWSVPYGAKTAREGKWVKGPSKAFIDVIKNINPEKIIIAEDLGDITPDVIELVKYSGFPGMRVLQFGFLDDADNPHLPHNYENNCIAYTGTHDNNTLLGYVWEQSADKRQKMLEYCGYTSPDWNAGYDSIIRTIFQSNAGLVILPIQDVLGYGSDTRLNTPGHAHGNWQFRITRSQLDSVDKNKYKKWNNMYKRG